MKKSLLLVDGNAVFYRAYHAFPKELSTPAGEPIGAVFGFTRILLNTIKTLKPGCVAVCFDTKAPTFRHLQYDEYKATRQKMPEDLAAQTERLYQVVEFLETPIFKADGYEADDVIGTLAQQAEAEGQSVVILTGDQDIIQLVTDSTSVYMPASPPKSPMLYTPEQVRERYGFTPRQMIEYKALRGDPSDNIPGVPGVGEVTATKLIQDFGTIDALYEALNAETPQIKPAVRQKLVDNEASARLSHELATIVMDAPVSLDLARCRIGLEHPEKLVALFQELGFKSLIRDLPQTEALLAHAADIFEAEAETPEIIADSESGRIDIALGPVLRMMEATGAKVDCKYLSELQKEFSSELEGRAKLIYQLAGEEFVLNSPAQVGHILYEVLGVPTKNIRRGKTGFTTDAATLQDLAEEYPIATLILQYREIDKLQSTYVKPLQEITDENSRVHTNYAPDTSTGRLSSRNPNLQNIPIKTEQGRRIRRAFVAETGWTLLSADYSQMELRVAAHLSGDTVMQDVFRQNGDFHAETATRMGVDRRTAKMLNFSILYGKGAFGFARDLGISVPDAKGYIDQYFRTYAKLREYLDGLLVTGREQGYLETLYGRRRAFPNLTSTNFHLRAAAEREALNMPIQGTQADILKKAMVDLAAALETEKLCSRMILTVHDELVLETTSEEQVRAATLLKEKMVGAATLDVPVEVGVKSGPNWAEMN
jgi:DNA polymerase I-like protein with 3'-5' exonuclease and polymerase domains